MVAGLLARAGLFIGGDLNDALDNLWFTLLFKRRDIHSIDDDRFAELVDVFVSVMQGAPLSNRQRRLVRDAAAIERPQHPPEWLAQRATSLTDVSGGGPGKRAWAWKEPNTHVVLDRLRAAMPDLRYLHVARNGLDMAYSENQNQPRFWLDAEPSPSVSLRYWVDVHRRILAIGAEIGDDFLFVDYDALCAAPTIELAKLQRFLGAGVVLDGSSIVPPASIGRFKAHGLMPFDPADVAFVAELGFDTTC